MIFDRSQHYGDLHLYKKEGSVFQLQSIQANVKKVLFAEIKDSEIIVILDEDEKLFLKKFKINSTCSVEVDEQIETEQLGLQFNFLDQSKLILPFGFETDLKVRETKAKGTIITILNILLTCLLVLLLIYIIILLKEKNDLSTRIRVLNDTNPSDVPLAH